MHTPVLAPSGWGFRPGTPLGPVTTATLPDLPVELRTRPLVAKRATRRNRAIVELLRAYPRLGDVTPDLVAKRYGLRPTDAALLIERATHSRPSEPPCAS